MNSNNEDIVARWNISLPDGKYKIEFEHGTTSGRRVIRVNDKVKQKKKFILFNIFLKNSFKNIFHSGNISRELDV